MDFKPKLVAFDLDGTLAESKQRVTPQMGELLVELLTKTCVAVLSGAGLPQFEKQLLPPLSESAHLERLYLFPTNAAKCYAYKKRAWAVQYDHSLNTIEKGKITQALKEAMAETGFTEAPKQLWGERIEDRGTQIAFSVLGQQAPVEAKRAWNQKYNEDRKRLYAGLLKRLPDFSIAMGGLTTIDITHKGINKAYGIRKLIELTDISISEMLYVGDALEEGGNDAVVIETGIKTHAVFGPEETAALIKQLVVNTHPS